MKCFLLGIMAGWTPSLVILALLLWPREEPPS